MLVVRLPERALADVIVDFAGPLLEGSEDPVGAVALAIDLWNAHVCASKLWGKPKTRPLADLRKAMRADAHLFDRLSTRWHDEFDLDPRLVGEWSFHIADGAPRLVCETKLPKGVDAHVPPAAEKRIAIGGAFLDEVRIRTGPNAYLGYPVEQHRGVVRSDGVIVHTKMATALQLFAEGRLKPIGDMTNDVAIGREDLGPLVLAEVNSGELCDYDLAVLVFRRP